MNVDVTQNSVQKALGKFLRAVLPTGYEVVAAVQNRVPEPKVPNFVIMTVIRMTRLRTNIDTEGDMRFTGSIAPAVSPAVGGVMTVTDVDFGEIKIGAIVFGVGVVAGTTVVSLISGTLGGTGVYEVSESQTIASEVLATGQKEIEQGTEVVVQCDFHTKDNTAADAAQTVATIFRDEYGVQLFADQNPPAGVVPLYADDPRYMPFQNDQQQYEYRWVVDAHMQMNQVVIVPAQYMDAIAVTLINVDATEPP